MNSALENSIAKARKMARNQDVPGAMALANEVLGEYPGEMQIWMLRGYLHELNEEYEEARADLTHAIEIDSLEPHLYYSRGRFAYLLGELQEAAQDFSKGLDLCDFHKNDYYRQELHFWRAATLLKLGERQSALNDLSEVAEDFSSWTDRLQTKRELVAACR